MKSPSVKELKAWLTKRPRESHKGRFGHLLILAGSRGMTGAAVLSAAGALRSGVGLVTLALAESQQNVAAAALPEAMTLGLPETSSGAVGAEAVSRIRTAHADRRFTALAAGPGLSTHGDTARALIGLLTTMSLPAVLDADALNLLALQARAEVAALFSRRRAPCVVTPHPGEAARLVRETTASIEVDRCRWAKNIAEEFRSTCLLKGARTVVTDGKRVYVNGTGNSGLAKGGSGDVLTGIIGGLWAQRLKMREDDDGFEAACLGAYLHGAAADAAVKEKTAYSLIASDVIAYLPKAFKKLGV